MKSMARLSNWLRIAALLGTAALAVASFPSTAAGINKPEPEYAKAKGDHCIKDDEFMIRRHPDLLKHQRNDTLIRGIRTTEYSLKRCMECHAGDNTGPSAGKTDCDSCHAFAAVKLDCWDCHAKKPGKPRIAPAKASQSSPMMTSVQPGEKPQ